MVKRRKFVVGLGALAAGGAAAMGTGAYDNGKTSVDSKIDIVADDEASINIADAAEGDQVDIVDGSLVINMGKGQSSGVQPGSVYTFDPAFVLTNFDQQYHDFTMSYMLDDYSGGSPAWANIFFYVTDNQGTYQFQAKEQQSGNANTASFTLGSGESADVKMRIDVKENADIADNLNGTLKIESSPSSQ
jgi:hypothetical protein